MYSKRSEPYGDKMWFYRAFRVVLWWFKGWFYGAFMVVLGWIHHGFIMVLSFHHGFIMVLSVCNDFYRALSTNNQWIYRDVDGFLRWVSAKPLETSHLWGMSR